MKLSYRRLLALVMCVVMCVSLFPASAFATEAVSPEPVVETPAAEPVAEVPAAEPVAVVPAAEPVVEVPAAEPVVEEPAAEPVVEVPAAEPVVEVPVAEPVVEVPVAEPVVEVPAAEPVVEVPAAEPVVEEPAEEPVAEEPVEEPALVEETEEALEPVEAALAGDDPIDSLEITGYITRFVEDRNSLDGYRVYNPDGTSEWYPGEYDRLDCWPRDEETLTVTLVFNGETYTNTAGEIEKVLNKGGYEVDWFSDERPGALYAAGEKHTATMVVGSHFASYDVYVTDNPVKSVEVEPITRYIYDRSINYNGWDVVDCWPYNEEITVEFHDLRGSVRGKLREVENTLRGQGFGLGWDSDETPDNPWSPGEHTATFSVNGVDCAFSVTVLADPVESLEVAGSVTRYVYDRHGMNNWWSDERNEWVYEDWLRLSAGPNYDESLTVTAVVVGRTYTGSAGEVHDALREAGYDFNIGWHSDETPENLWDVGDHTAVFDLGNHHADYTVHVLADPVESLTVEGSITRAVDARHGMNNWWNEEEGRWVDEFWFRLSAGPNYDKSLQVTTKVNGRTYTGTAGEVHDALRAAGYDITIGWHSDETPENLWDLGDHTAVFDLGNKHAEYTVHVVPSPFKSMTVDDVTRYDTDLTDWRDYQDENGDWKEADHNWRVDAFPQTIHVTVEIGGETATISGNPDEVRGRLWDDYGINVESWFWNSEQVYGAAEIPETIPASFRFASLTANYTLHVISNPIDSVTVSPISRYILDRNELWGWSDSKDEWHDENWDRVDAWPHDATVTVTFKDGRAPLSGKLHEIEDTLRKEFDLGWHSDETPENVWKPGEHTATLDLAGLCYDYTVTVLPNPLKTLTVDDQQRFDTELDGWTNYWDESKNDWVDAGRPWRIGCHPNTITVTGEIDGQSFTISNDVDSVCDTLRNEYGVNVHNWYWESDQVYGEEIPETINARFTFGLLTASYKVHVISNPIASVTVSPISRYILDRNELWGWNDSKGEWHDENWDRVDCWPYDATVTVTFKDGRAPLSGKLYEIEDTLRKDFELGWHSDEGPEDPWSPGAHTATLDLAGVGYDYAVTVLPSPLKTMTIDDLNKYDTELDGWSDYWDENKNEWVDPGEAWRINCYPNNITVTYEVDGETRTVSGDPGEVGNVISETFGFNIRNWGWDSDQVYGEAIPATIHASFEFANLSANYAVHVTANPIATLTVTGITRYVIGREQQWGWQDTKGDWHDEEWYRVACWPHDADVTVTFKDGRAQLSGKLYEIEDALREDFDIWHDCDDTPEHPWTVGEHTATFYVAGFGADYTVNVLPSPITALTVDDLNKYDNDLSGWTDYWDTDRKEWVDPGHQWRIECFPENLTVTVEIGGESYTYSGYPREVRDTLNEKHGLNLGEDCGWNSDQVYGEAIPSTIHAWFDFFGTVANYTVRVTANPIASVTVSPISRYVINRNMMWGWNDSNGDWHDGQWFRLDAWPHDATVTVTFKDGREPISGRLSDIEDTLREDFNVWWDSDETPENPWGPGKHTATFYVADIPADYEVTVLPDPFKSMTVDDCTRYDNDLTDWRDYQDENGQNQDPEENWRIECFPQNVTLTVDIGGETITLTGNPGEIRDRLNGEYGFNLNDESWHWDSDQVYGEPVPETINATFEWGLLSADYKVHVVENPIDTVTVSDISRYEYETRMQDGYWNNGVWIDESYPCIACYPWDADVTVTFKDGREPLSGKLHEIQDTLFESGFDIGHEQDETPLDPWVAGGAYTSILWIGGVPGTFKVHVLADPVQSLTVTGGITRYAIERNWSEDWYDEDRGEWTGIGWYELDCWPRDDANLTVTAVVGGKTYTGTANQVESALHEDGYEDLYINFNSKERPDNPFGPGTYTVWFELGGKSAAYSLEVLADPLKTFAVKNSTRLDTDLDEWRDYYDEASDRWIDPGYQWRISCWPRNITVTLEIGGVSDTLTGSPDDVRDALRDKYGIDMGNNWRWDSDQIFGEPVPAVINASMDFCSLSANYTVAVVKDPVRSVVVAPVDRLTTDLAVWLDYYDYTVDEWKFDQEEPWRIDCRPDEVTVTLKDGYSFPDGSTVKVYTWDNENGLLWQIGDDLHELTGADYEVHWNSNEIPSAKFGPGVHDAWIDINNNSYHYEVRVSEPATSGVCGDELTWRYADGVLTIEGSGDMYDYLCRAWQDENSFVIASISTPWYAYAGEITEVRLPDGLTSIGEEAFGNFTKLRAIEIPASVTRIGEDAFLACTALEEIAIPAGVSVIESGTFYKCSALTEVTIPETVTEVAPWAFGDCNALTTVHYPGTEEAWNRIAIDPEGNEPLLREGVVSFEGRIETELVVDESLPEIKVSNFTSDLGETTLTEEESERAETEDAKITLAIDKLDTLPAEDQAALDETEYAELAVGLKLDLSLTKQIGEDAPEPVTETETEISVEMAIPEALLNTDETVLRIFTVVRIHNGVAEAVGVSTDLSIRFTSDRFSSFVLVYEDVKDFVIGKLVNAGSAKIALFPATNEQSAVMQALLDGDYTDATKIFDKASASFTCDGMGKGEYYFTMVKDGLVPYVQKISVDGKIDVGSILLTGWGDVNGDGKRDADDALQILLFLQSNKGGLVDNAYLQAAACVSNRGALTPTAADATLLQKCAIGLASIG